MAVLEPTELERRSADKALAISQDESLVKFDQILRVQQVKQGTRSTYFWQLLRLKRNLARPVAELDSCRYGTSEGQLYRDTTWFGPQSGSGPYFHFLKRVRSEP